MGKFMDIINEENIKLTPEGLRKVEMLDKNIDKIDIIKENTTRIKMITKANDDFEEILENYMICESDKACNLILKRVRRMLD